MRNHWNMQMACKLSSMPIPPSGLILSLLGLPLGKSWSPFCLQAPPPGNFQTPSGTPSWKFPEHRQTPSASEEQTFTKTSKPRAPLHTHFATYQIQPGRRCHSHFRAQGFTSKPQVLEPVCLFLNLCCITFRLCDLGHVTYPL